MAKAKITLTGILEKAPNIKENGNVDLLFKTTMSSVIPKGLQSLQDTYCIVRVAPKTWKKVSSNYKSDSKLLIQGEVGIGINTKGTSYIEVIAFDIGLIENKEKKVKDESKKQLEDIKKPVKESNNVIANDGVKEIDFSEIKLPEEFLKSNINPVKLSETIEYYNKNGKFDKPIIINKNYQLVDGYKRYLAAKELEIKTVPVIFGENKIVKSVKGKNTLSQGDLVSEWHKGQPKTDIQIKDIVLTESIHLRAKNINMFGALDRCVQTQDLTPVVIRKLDNGKYSLVTGLKSYCIAKIMDIPKLSAIFTDLTHDKFMKERGWKE
jgi:hypothetical protein